MFVFFALSAAFLGGVAGLTAGKLLTRAGEKISTVGGLFPVGTLDPAPPDPVTGKTNWTRIIVLAVLCAIGVTVVKWFGKKLNIKFLKH